MNKTWKIWKKHSKIKIWESQILKKKTRKGKYSILFNFENFAQQVQVYSSPTAYTKIIEQFDENHTQDTTEDTAEGYSI